MAKTLIAFYSRRGDNWVDGSVRFLPKGNNEVIVEKIKALLPEAVPFISREDIDDFTIIKYNEWADKYHIYAQVPKDNILITTKKESRIKTFVLNGKPTKRRRGIELGLLLDEVLLKQHIQKKWRIKSNSITGITIEGKTICITTKK